MNYLFSLWKNSIIFQRCHLDQIRNICTCAKLACIFFISKFALFFFLNYYRTTCCLFFFWHCPKISIKSSSAGRWHRNVRISYPGGNWSIPGVPTFPVFSQCVCPPPEQTWGCSPCAVTTPAVPRVCYPDGSSDPLLRGKAELSPVCAPARQLHQPRKLGGTLQDCLQNIMQT